MTTQPNNVSITKEQEEVVIGLILGDGNLSLEPNKLKARLRYEHALKQILYMDQVFNEISGICTPIGISYVLKTWSKDRQRVRRREGKPPIPLLDEETRKYLAKKIVTDIREKYSDRAPGDLPKEMTDILYEINTQCYITTLPSERLKDLFNLFYREITTEDMAEDPMLEDRKNLKIVPNNIASMVTPKTLYYWFMDDGSLKGKDRKGFHIATNAFSFQDTQRLIDVVFHDKFGISAVINPDRNKPRIYIKAEAHTKFVDIIKPYVIPSMKYKLGL